MFHTTTRPSCTMQHMWVSLDHLIWRSIEHLWRQDAHSKPDHSLQVWSPRSYDATFLRYVIYESVTIILFRLNFALGNFSDRPITEPTRSGRDSSLHFSFSMGQISRFPTLKKIWRCSSCVSCHGSTMRRWTSVTRERLINVLVPFRWRRVFWLLPSGECVTIPPSLHCHLTAAS